MQLRPYQEDMIARTRDALRTYRTALLQGPTGCGKTAITVYMMSRAAERGISSMFIVHQNELLRQTSRALWQQKLEHGMIASGKRVSKMSAQVASVQTLVRRLDDYAPPGLIIVDEAHRSAADTYRKVLKAYPGAKVIGLTATPERTDGKGLGDIYQTLIQGPSIVQLIQAGYLCDYEIFAPPSSVDMSGVRTKMGDYDRAEVAERMDKPTITGDAVAHYIRHAMGKRCVVMAVTIAHGNHIADQYNASGVPAAMIEGGMTDSERETTLQRFAAGEILVLVNVQLMIEGVDIPSIQAVQWLRPTASLIIWMQGNGRGLRPAPGKDKLIIFDHVGNVHKHGLPDDDREWTLEGQKPKGKRKTDDEPDVHVQQCQKCYHVFRPGVDKCPSCGAPVPKREKAQIEVIDGALEKVDLEAERTLRRREQGSARLISELVRLGIRRGIKRPAEWAAFTFAGRAGRKPTPQEYDEARRAYKETGK